MDNNTGHFFIVEWSIRNFSFWKREIHGKSIPSPKSSFLNLQFELFPRGLNDDDERLAVHVRRDTYCTYSGDLTLFSSNGLALCKQQVDSKDDGSLKKQSVHQLPPAGPTFGEVVANIRKNADLHGDRLTLRFRWSSDRDAVENLRTAIDVLDFSLKISPKSFEEDSNTEGKLISCFKYPRGGYSSEVTEMQLLLSRSKTDSSRVALILRPISSGVSVLTRMFVLNNDNDVVRTEDNEHVFLRESYFRNGNENWTFSNSLTINEVREKGFSLILCIKIPSNNYRHCSENTFIQNTSGEVTVLPSSTFNLPVSEEYFFEPDNSLTVLRKELMGLYQDRNFSDFRLRCGRKTFHVHKAILSARSPVFKRLLSSDMREAASGVVDIVDMDSDTLGLFLIFLYNGTVDALQGESALKLYYAADKYHVPTLKKRCSEILRVSISVSNVGDILSLAEKHQDERLSSAAQDFILKNEIEGVFFTCSGDRSQGNGPRVTTYLLNLSYLFFPLIGLSFLIILIYLVYYFGFYEYLCSNIPKLNNLFTLLETHLTKVITHLTQVISSVSKIYISMYLVFFFVDFQNIIYSSF